MWAALLSYARDRARLVLAATGLGILLGSSPPVPAPGIQGVQDLLGRSIGGRAESFCWGPQEHVIRELFIGRSVLFLGRRPGGRAEVYRALARLSAEGHVLSVHRIRNLTGTDLAEESSLTCQGEHALFMSESPGTSPTLSVLALTPARSKSPPLFDRLLIAAQNYVTVGTPHGLGRADIVLPEKAQHVSARQVDGDLVLLVDDRPSRLPLSALLDPLRSQELDLPVLPRPSQAPPFWHFAADVGRTILGARAVAWSEEVAFRARDLLARAGYTLTHPSTEAPKPVAPLSRAPAPDTAASPEALPPWPPERIPSRWPKPRPGEGEWKPLGQALLPRSLPTGSAPLFYETFVRPDPERPYAEHVAVVMDLRRLELGLRGGYEDPKPRTGPPGSGHIPEDADTVQRVVATFNGAFKTTHGSYGMKAEGRVLVPPKDGAATLRIDPDGAVGLGLYRAAEQPSLDEAVAYRQNLDPLLHEGQVLPTKRTDWGDHLIGSTVAAERSGVCVRTDGHLVYVWSQEATAESLARGMALLGCTSGMHLDMNPGHCTFALHRVESFDPLKAESRLLRSTMRSNASRYLRWSPKDFFYLALRSPYPSSEAAASLTWEPAPGTNPAPGELPPIVLGKERIAGLDLEIERVDLSAVSLTLSVGSAEATAAPPALTDSRPLLGAWSLGHATLGHRAGLSIGALAVVAMDRRYATLVLGQDGRVLLRPPGEPAEPREHQSAVQLQLLARDGTLLDHARRITAQRLHGALCVDDHGSLWIGRMLHDTPAPLAQRLLSLGCQDVAELDRGSQAPARALRPDDEAELTAEHPGSFLVGRARMAGGRGYAF